MKAYDTALCTACGNIFKKNDTMTCPACHYHLDADSYSRMERCAYNVMHFGHSYREIYEIQYSKENPEEIRYSLFEPSSIALFVGIAALTGIIGNATYDVVKTVISKVIKHYKISATEEDISKYENDKNIQLIIRNIIEFLKGLEGVKEEVRSAIIEEIICHYMTDEMMKEFGTVESLMPNLENVKDSLAVRHESAIESFKKDQPRPEDFHGLWINL